MGKVIKVFCAVLCFVIMAGMILFTTDMVYQSRIAGRYYDEIGDVYGETLKNQGLSLQKESVSRQDNLLVFGSSELGSKTSPFYVVDFFSGKKDGFQVNLIGRGYSQSIIHAINIGALGQNLKDKKIIFIMSPQWFSESGLRPAEFNMNFSELQFYTFMFNKDMDSSIKLDVAKRVRKLSGADNEFSPVKIYCDLYTSNNILADTVLAVLMPYYKFMYYLLTIKDKIRTYDYLKKYSGKTQVLEASSTSFDWEAEKSKAVDKGREEASSNEFLIENSYYDKYIKDNLKGYKGSYKNSSYLKSPEYEDFKIFLDICKSLEVKPLIISVPVHGKWYDYCGFSKEDREGYYNRVREMVASYGFQMADFSGHEYDDYFLKDIMHLGWKGWVYVNEAIDKFYNEYTQ